MREVMILDAKKEKGGVMPFDVDLSDIFASFPFILVATFDGAMHMERAALHALGLGNKIKIFRNAGDEEGVGCIRCPERSALGEEGRAI